MRTLLFNRDGGTPAEFAAEHVPSDYRAVSLPSGLQRVRRVLFGHDPDATGLNYRLRQFAALLHAPDIEPYTLAGDSRVTYWPADDVCFRMPLGLLREPLNGTAVAVLQGEVPLSRSGRLKQSWLVTADETNELNIDPEQMPGDPVTETVSWDAGLSNHLSLPGASPLTFRLSGEEITAGTRFRLLVYTRYETSLAGLPDQLESALAGDGLQLLFGGDAEPYVTFRRWWQDSTQLTNRLSGVLLALARRTDDIRKGK